MVSHGLPDILTPLCELLKKSTEVMHSVLCPAPFMQVPVEVTHDQPSSSVPVFVYPAVIVPVVVILVLSCVIIAIVVVCVR